MSKNEYLENARNAYDSGRISAEAYDAVLTNIDYFCKDEEGDFKDELSF